MKHLRNVLAALSRADHDYSLIDEGDRILVGLSGGKDSLSLLKALSLYGFYSKKKFEVRPCFLDLGFGNADLEGLKEFSESLGYELLVSDSRFVYDVLRAHQKKGKHIPCSICSRMKKAAINRLAKDNGFNKVAFAHHNEDAVETLFMNMLHGGRVATFEPKMYLEKAGITFIRPLIYCHEDDLKALAKEENLPVLASACPANGFTEREVMKEFLQGIYEKYPESKDNFRTLLWNYEPFQLYFSDLEYSSDLDFDVSIKPVITAEEMRGSSFAMGKKEEGEVDFLILRRHQRVGEIAYRHLTDHRVKIFGLKGKSKDLRPALSLLEDRLVKKVNPLTLVLSGASKELQRQAHYEKKSEPGIKGEHYIKKRNS